MRPRSTDLPRLLPRPLKCTSRPSRRSGRPPGTNVPAQIASHVQALLAPAGGAFANSTLFSFTWTKPHISSTLHAQGTEYSREWHQVPRFAPAHHLPPHQPAPEGVTVSLGIMETRAFVAQRDRLTKAGDVQGRVQVRGTRACVVVHGVSASRPSLRDTPEPRSPPSLSYFCAASRPVRAWTIFRASPLDGTRTKFIVERIYTGHRV